MPTDRRSRYYRRNRMSAETEPKECERCKEWLPLVKFVKQVRKSGIVYYPPTCKKCYDSDRLAKLRREKAACLEAGIPRQCAECAYWLPVSYFNRESGVCLRCYDRTRNLGYIYYVKIRAQSSCAICGCNNPLVLEFAHYNRADKARTKSGKPLSITKMKNEDRVKAELSKGRFLCAFHHRLETAEENGKNSRTCIQARQTFVNQEKARRGGCTDCERPIGSSFSAFDFDHVDASTKITEVSVLVSKCKSFKEIAIEMSKCEMVCRCCHILRTLKRHEEKRDAMKRKMEIISSLRTLVQELRQIVEEIETEAIKVTEKLANLLKELKVVALSLRKLNSVVSGLSSSLMIDRG